MTGPLRILHLEDSSNDAELVRAALTREGIDAEWQRVQTRNDYIAALDRNTWSLILADYHLPSFDGMSALVIARDKCPDVPFIFVSGAIEEQLAIEALTTGATDYVFKSNLKRLAPVVIRSLEEARLQRERKEYEVAIQQLINNTSALTGHDFFKALVRDLAAMLHTQYAFIGLIADKDITHIRTITLWAGGDYAENFEYALQDTPCENVVGKAECFYPREVQRLFPQDHLLAEMNLESYHGMPLFRSDGTPLGLLSVFDTQPMEALVHLRPLVRVFASRAAAELERLEAEQKLQEGQTAVRESERRLATLMDNLQGMAYRCRNDSQWTMEFVSGGCEELTGYAQADLVMNRKLAYADIIVPEDRQAVWEKIQHAVEAKTPFVLEYRITTAAGAVKWVWEHGCCVYRETGELIALEGLISDITDRKRAETELERKTALTALLEALARAANEAATTEAALRVCLEHICTYGRWTLGHAALYAPGQTSGMAQMSLWHGKDQKRYEEVIRLSNEYAFNKRHGGFVGAALSDRKPVWVEDLASAAKFGRLAVIAKSGLRAGFVFPVIMNDGIAAFLEFFAAEVRAPDTLLLEAIGSVAGQLARLIERSRAEAANSQLATIVESSPDAIISRTIDGAVLSWNAGAERIYGYSAQEMIGQNIAILVPPGEMRTPETSTGMLLRGETPPLYETIRLTKDGRRIRVEISISGVRDAIGKITQIAAIHRDVTASKRAEAERTRLAAIVENSNDAIMTRTLDGIITSWNAGAERMLGYSAVEAIGQPATFVLLPDRQHHLAANTKKVLRSEVVIAHETKRLTKDGRIIDVLSNHSPIRDESGKVIGASVILNDISELKRAEATHAQLAAIVESSEDAILSIDPEGVICTWNTGAERMLGYTTAEMIGRTSRILFPDDLAQETGKMRALCLAGTRVAAQDTIRLTKDGRRIDVSISASPIRDGAGHITGAAFIYRDISERKRAEASRAQFAAIVSGSNDAIVSRSTDRRVLTWNTTAERLFGYTAAEIIGRDIAFLIPPDREQEAVRNRELLAQGHPVLDMETVRLAKDGRAIDVSLSQSPIRDERGTVTGVSLIFRDISERKQATADRARLAAIVENSNEAIVSRTLDGVITSWNAGAQRMLGYSASEMIGQPFTLIHPPGHVSNHHRLSERLLRGEAIPPHQTQRITKDGKMIDVLSSVSPMKDSAGKVVGASVIFQDITALKQAEATIRESEERFHAAFEQAGVGMGLRDIDPLKPRWIRVNQKLCDILGYSREELLQLTSVDLTPPEDRDTAIDYNQRLLRGEIRNYTREKRYVRKDGRIIWVNLTMSAVYDPDGRPIYIVSVLEDITDRKLAAQALRDSEEQFRQLATNIPEVFWIIDGETGAVTYVSPAFEAIWGRKCEEFRADPAVWTDAIHPDDRERMSVNGEVFTRSGKKKDYRIVRPDGTIRWIHDQSFPVMENGRLQRIIGIAEDITERKENEAQLLHLVHYDSLTDFPNRVLFRDRLLQALVLAQRNDWLVGVLIIGIDRFKNINDTYGYEAGDKVLREAGLRIAACTRPGDTVGRHGGDEFGIILSNLGAEEDASLVSHKIMSSLVLPVVINGSEIFLSVSIGISLYPADGKDADNLIRDANAAVRRAKELGRNNAQFYKSEMNARAKERLGLESSLRRALDNNEFLLHYQPKISLQAGEITGFEALIRWQHPEKGMVSPADFVPMLEETGLILPVGDWVLRTACDQARAWRDSGLGPVTVAVNLSVRQFMQPGLDQHVLKIVQESGIAPDLLELEITESFLMHDPEEAAQTLLKLKAAGIRISVDDFGTGYSSLGYLTRFPVDSVKIDRSFIRDVTKNPENAAITRAVIGLARNLGMKSVAEGVETETQLGFLSANDCDEMQGYFFSRPLPVAECTRMLEEGRRLTSHIRSGQPERFTVLLVDDEENVLEALDRVLRRDGYRILTARSATAGLELLATHEVGVVISDERMPDMTGVAFLSRVCKMYPDTIRMVLTGYTNMQTIISAINDGAVYKFLQKPWDNTALRGSVRDAFRLYELKRPAERNSGAETGSAPD